MRLRNYFIKINILIITLILSINSNIFASPNLQDSITGLYIAYYNRAPDQEGINYWKGRAFLEGESSALLSISEGFSNHPEFKKKYPDSDTNNQFVTKIYHNMLNRKPDSAGLAYWVSQLEAGLSKKEFIVSYVNTVLGFEGNDPDALKSKKMFTNKVTVGNYFVDKLGVLSNGEVGTQAYKRSIEVLSLVTKDSSTVAIAKNKVNTYLSGGYDLKVNLYIGIDEEGAKLKKKQIMTMTGHSVTYQLIYTNPSTSTIKPTGTKIYIDYDENKLEITSMVDSCIDTGSQISCNGTDLSPGWKNTSFYTAKIKPGVNSLIKTRVTIKTNSNKDPNPLNDTSSVNIALKYADLAPYQQNHYSNKLKACVRATSSSSCTMQTLPLIGQKTDNPTTKDILDRLIVSDRWMGDRFKQLLAIFPDDIKLLLRSVTAIVIDGDIRPSHYKTRTGAIYLDPATLWLSNEEKKDIRKDEDYRAGFGNGLSFKEYSAYTIKNQFAFPYRGSIYDDRERILDDIKLPFVRLLYHELAHANDYAPFVDLASFNKALSIYKATDIHTKNNENLSWKLKLLDPLHSSTLHSLAQVLYQGQQATDEEKEMSAVYVGVLFAMDGAVSLYNYSTIREDLAMLFEAAMMKYHYNLDYDLATIYNDEEHAKNTIGWGTRNRIANPLVTNRAKFVVEQIFPEKSWHSFFQNDIGEETLKVSNTNWYNSLTQIQSRQKSSRLNQTLNSDIFMRSPHESLSRYRLAR